MGWTFFEWLIWGDVDLAGFISLLWHVHMGKSEARVKKQQHIGTK